MPRKTNTQTENPTVSKPKAKEKPQVISIPRNAVVVFAGGPYTGKSKLCDDVLTLFSVGSPAQPFALDNELTSANKTTLEAYHKALEDAKEAGETPTVVSEEQLRFDARKLVFSKLNHFVRTNPALATVEIPAQATPGLVHDVVDSIKAIFRERPLVLIKITPSNEVFSYLYGKASEDNTLMPRGEADAMLKEFRSRISMVNHAGAYSRTSEYTVINPENVKFNIAS